MSEAAGGAPTLPPLLAMADALPVAALRELERALTLRLNHVSTAADERVRELGLLAQLLQRAELPEVWRPPADLPEDRRWPERPVVPHLERRTYDELRPSTAPCSHDLVKHYGGWTKACRAAFGLRDDGRTTGPGKPWRSWRAKRLSYTREEAVAAVRECALALQRRPTTSDYYNWRRAEQRRRAQAGSPKRVPTLDVVYRQFRTWPRAVAAAAITDADLAAARSATGPSGAGSAQDLGGPRAAISRLPLAQWVELGMSDDEAAQVSDAGFGHLGISRAVTLAAALGGSLDWLAERTPEPGVAATPDARFDGDHFKHLRRRRQVPEAAVRELLDLPLGPYRKLLNGTWEPPLGVVRSLAELLDVGIGELVGCGVPSERAQPSPRRVARSASSRPASRPAR